MEFETIYLKTGLIISPFSPNWRRPQAGVFLDISDRNSRYGSKDLLLSDSDVIRYIRSLRPVQRDFNSVAVSCLGFWIFLRSLVIPANRSNNSRSLTDLMRTRSSCFEPTMRGALSVTLGLNVEAKRSFRNPSMVPSQITISGDAPQRGHWKPFSMSRSRSREKHIKHVKKVKCAYLQSDSDSCVNVC